MKKLLFFLMFSCLCTFSAYAENSYVAKFVTDKANAKMQAAAEDAFNKAMAEVARKYDYSDFKFSEGFAKGLEDGKIKEALGKVNDLKGLWDDAVNDRWGSFAYKGAKEALQKILPVSEHIFKIGEGYYSMMKGISDHVTDNNLSFIRAVYVQEVLHGSKKPKSAIITRDQVEAVTNFLRGNQMVECSAYSKDNCTTVLGKNRCGCVGYGLAQFMGKGSWFWKAGVGGNEADRALALFIRQDKQIAELLRNYVTVQENREYFINYEKMVKKSEAYVEKKVKDAVRRIAEEESARQNRPTRQTVTVKTGKYKTEQVKAAKKRVDQISEQIRQIDRSFQARYASLNDRNTALQEKSKGIKGAYITYDEILPEVRSIDETQVDNNTRKAKQYEKMITRSEMAIEYHRLEIERQRLSLEKASQLYPLQIQNSTISKQYGLYGSGGSGEVVTNGVEFVRHSVERRIKQEEEKITALQKNIPIFKEQARIYKAAAQEGERLARKEAERLATLDLEKLQAQQKAYQQKMEALEKVEQEKNVDLDRLIDEVRNAETAIEVKTVAKRAGEDLADYAKKLDEYREVSAQMTSSEAYQQDYSSAYLSHAEKTVADIEYQQVSQIIPKARPGGKMVLGFTPYLEAFAKANAYLEKELGAREREMRQLTSEMRALVTYSKVEMDSLYRELAQLKDVSAVLDKAVKIARLEEFNAVFARDKKVNDIYSRSVVRAFDGINATFDGFVKQTQRKFRDMMRQRADFGLPKVGNRLSLHHQSPSPHILENNDVQDGSLPFVQEVSGKGLVGCELLLTVNGDPVELEREVDESRRVAIYSAELPVEGMQKVLLHWDEIRSGKVQRSGDAELKIPFSSTAVGEIEKLYQQFQQAYSSQDLYGLLRLVDEDWTAFDGTDIDDLEELLDNSFNVFDSVEYRIRGIKVRKREDGNHEATYSIDLVGNIRDGNLKHTESSRITEVVGLVDGKWRILQTVSGQFWRN